MSARAEGTRSVRRWLAIVGRISLLVVGASLIATARPRVVRLHAAGDPTREVYPLPNPEQVLVLSLGYRAALADFIYAHVLVSYGLHFEERRRFEHVGRYLDTVTTLDPTFRQPYLFADTLLTVQPVEPQRGDYHQARRLLRRGTENLPYDQEVWFVAGQFLTYIAPPRLEDKEEKAEFRLEGAKLLARACELVTDNPNIPQHCLTAANLLHRAGEREAMMQMLSRTLAVVDDETVQQRALAALQKWGTEQELERFEARRRAFEDLWQADLPFVSKDRLLLLGPPLRALQCVGDSAVLFDRLPVPTACATTWHEWSVLSARRTEGD